MSRKEEFEKLILESYQIVFEYYRKILSADPGEKVQLFQEIDEGWEYTKIFLSDYTSLCEIRRLTPLDEIIDIAAMRFRDLAIRLETIVASKPTFVSAMKPSSSAILTSSSPKTASSPILIQGVTLYAQADEQLCKELTKHLNLLQAEGLIHEWYNREIKPEQDWTNEIDAHLNTANIVLLLVSPDFMVSKYCYGAEMKRVLARPELEEVRIIPIILRPVDWRNAPFCMFQSLPRSAKPVTTWQNPEEALLDIAHAIRDLIKDIHWRNEYLYNGTLIQQT